MLPLIFYSVILLQVSALLAATICTKRAEVHASAQRKYEGLCYPLQESDMLRTCRLNTTVIFVVYSSHKLRVKVIQSTVLPCRNNVRCPGLDQAEASLCAPVSPSLSRCYKSKPPLVFTLKWFISIKITFGSVRKIKKSRARVVSPELERWHRVHGDMEAGDRLVDVLLWSSSAACVCKPTVSRAPPSGKGSARAIQQVRGWRHSRQVQTYLVLQKLYKWLTPNLRGKWRCFSFGLWIHFMCGVRE